MIEYEKKIMLSLWEYLRLLNQSSKHKQFTQINYYYDTADLKLHEQGITCRIREKNGVYTATKKIHNYAGADGSKEISVIVHDENDSSVFDIPDLILYGKMKTQRTIIYEDSYIEVALDANTYLGYTDYELEIERINDSQQQTEQMLWQLAHTLYGKDNIFIVNSFFDKINADKNKSGRFFERIKAQKMLE